MPLLPKKMTAIKISEKGGPDVLVAETLDIPQPSENQILIKVSAAGINRPDILQRKGLYPAPKGHNELPGLEVSGEIVAVGSNVSRFQNGQRVMALVNGGGYAEYCLSDEATTLKIPDNLSFAEAAGIPETYFTVWHNVFERGRLIAGEWLLIHGGTSGIGVTAIQLAKSFGAKVMATVGSDEKCKACLDLGAHKVINYNKEDYYEVVKSQTNGQGVNLILDMVGGDYIDKNLRCLAEDGRLVYIGFQKGSVATLDLMRVMLKRLTITGSTLRIRSLEVKRGISQQLERNVIPLLATGSIKVPIDSIYPLQNAADAHRHMEEGRHIGKIILQVI